MSPVKPLVPVVKSRGMLYLFQSSRFNRAEMGEDMKMDKEYGQSPGRPVTQGVRESTAVYDHSRTAGQEMLGKYVVIEPEKVLGFIENHKFLNDLLLQAVQEIKVYFPSSELFLEVKSDVENREDTKLVLSICPDYSPE
jgi:hypothetical protein